jgi:hypothetical protein
VLHAVVDGDLISHVQTVPEPRLPLARPLDPRKSGVELVHDDRRSPK